jgi:hypothetical protein
MSVPPFLCSLLSFLLVIFVRLDSALLLCSRPAPQTLPVQCGPLTYCGTLDAAGYYSKYLDNLALPASERMNQTFDLEAWKARMTTCVQILEGSSAPDGFEVWKLLDYSSVPGSPLPRRTKSRKGVLNRPKGTKRDRHMVNKSRAIRSSKSHRILSGFLAKICRVFILPPAPFPFRFN